MSARRAERSRTGGRLPLLLLAVVVIVSSTATLLAMRRTSTTFDEIVMVGAGVRGLAGDGWGLVPEQPPLTKVLYGLPVRLAGVTVPDESGYAPAEMAGRGYQTEYARNLYWRTGNDPQRVAFLGRLPAVAMAALLVLATYLLARGPLGPWPALLAAGAVAFLPDVLAHGGVAYNDVPMALAYLVAVHALDGAVRRPTPGRGALAGLATALAIGVKFSAVLLGPVALVLVAAEGLARRGDVAWRRALGRSALAGLAVLYGTLVVLYRGDADLSALRFGLDFTLNHVSAGHGIDAYFMGRTSPTGWWWFYPAAFVFKTPVAFHLLLLLALGGLGAWAWQARGAWSREALRWPLRAAVVGFLAYLGVLLSASLFIGFRHALPALPLLCILVAGGVARAYRARGRVVAVAAAALLLWQAGSVLSWHPWYLSYVSEYVGDRDQGHRVLVDSSVDWGQGLLELAAVLRARSIDRVYLSYFGSALPWGYGIDYVPLPSFFTLDPPPAPGSGAPEPRWAVVSATHLHPVYVEGPMFERFRRMAPDTVVAHTLYLYRLP